MIDQHPFRPVSAKHWCAILSIVAAAFAAFALVRLSDDDLAKVLLLVIAAVVAVSSFDRPEIALFAVPVFVVFDRRVTLAGQEVQIALLALVAFAPALFKLAKTVTVDRNFTYCVGAFVLGAALATFRADDDRTTVPYLLLWLLAWLYGAAIAAAVSMRRGLVATLGLEVSILGAAASILGFLQSMQIYTVVGPPYVADRIDSSFGWYTVFGNYVAVSAVIASATASYYIGKRRHRLAALSVLVAVVNTAGVVLTLSRGAVLCVAVGIAYLVGLRLRRPILAVFTSAALVLVGTVAALAAPDGALQQVSQRFAEAQGGDVLRAQLQEAGLTLLQSSPLGIGYGQFAGAVQAEGVLSGRTLFHAHQLFIQAGLDFGWLGLAGLMGSIGIGILRSFKRNWREPDLAEVGFGAALLGTLAQGFGDYLFYETAPVIMVTMTVGVLAATAMRKVQTSGHGTRTDGPVLRNGVERRHAGRASTDGGGHEL